MTETVTETAYAKINLTLRVLGRRSNGFGAGYHELESLIAFAELGDRISLTPTREKQALGPPPARLEVTGPFASAIVGENLVALALARVEQAAGRRLASHIVLDKQLPVAAGIGGGSADAAAILRVLKRACSGQHSSLQHIDWLSLAASLGADVPVCLESRPAWLTGIGEHLHPVQLPRLDIVLANPLTNVPADKTRRVFQILSASELPALTNSSPPHGPSLSEELSLPRLIELMRKTGNDLEPAAMQIVPALGPVKAAVAACPGCLVAVLSGAGPTVAGVFASSADAAAAASSLGHANPGWWVRATQCGAAVS